MFKKTLILLVALLTVFTAMLPVGNCSHSGIITGSGGIVAKK